MYRPRIIRTLLLAVWLAPGIVWAQPAGPQWKAVQSDINRGLPKDAIKKLNPILQQATAAGRHAEAVRAIGTMIALEGQIQGGKPEEKIARLAKYLATAPKEQKPTLQAILANWYWAYFQENRWRIMRTPGGESGGDDLTSWGLPRVLEEIDKQFTAALNHSDDLKRIPIAQYNDLLKKGNAPDSYRPTLYDFIAHNALAFYTTGEQAGSKSIDQFELQSDGPIFGAWKEFAEWTPQAPDENSPTLKAVKLFQQLLQFHADDSKADALLDVDLARIVFGNNVAIGRERTNRYKAALQRLIEENAEHPISARAIHHIASLIRSEGDLVEARRRAIVGRDRFADSVGGRRCANLIKDIEQPSAQVVAERVWNHGKSTIDIRYRNLTAMHFRLVSTRFTRILSTGEMSISSLHPIRRRQLLNEPVVHAWNVTLPETTDYQEKLHQITAPDDLAPGPYYLIASRKPDFSDANNQIVFERVWVSELALIMRAASDQGRLEGFVLDAESGDPIAEAMVKVWKWEGRTQRYYPVKGTSTNENGMFQVPDSGERNVVVYVEHGDQSIATSRNYREYAARQPGPSTQTRLFTDRALYRPGQLIQYKGICISLNQQTDDYGVLRGRSLDVVLKDHNGKEVERRRHRSNDYGSFSGTVTAPSGRITGPMSLVVESGPRGMTSMRVEEYKRPKFKVTMESPDQQVRLNEEVTISGRAAAYSEAAISGAAVRWRVTRDVRYPRWWGWRCWWMPIQTPTTEIAHGRLKTDAQGRFEITFDAAADKSVPKESQSVFVYRVYADVTDTTGETRGTQAYVNVGYTGISATLSADAWQTQQAPVELRLRTTTIAGKPSEAKCKVTVYSLRQPEKVSRAALQGQNYRLHSQSRPAEIDPQNPNSWPTDEAVFQDTVTVGPSGSATISAPLTAGIYRAEVETEDAFGNPVSSILPLTVLNPDSNQYNIRLPHAFTSRSLSLEPGSEYLGLWGSGYKRARSFVEIEHRGQIIKSFWTSPEHTQTAIRHPITESLRGGFIVHVTMVRENRGYLKSQRVDVPWSNKSLKVRWERFRSKLKPGGEETWTAIIDPPKTGPNQDAVPTEMVAALYDASLDAFQQHHWQNSFGVFRYDHSRRSSNFENMGRYLRYLYGTLDNSRHHTSLTYRSLPPIITYRRGAMMGGGFGGGGGVDRQLFFQPQAAEMAFSTATMDANQLANRASRGQDKRRRAAAPGVPPEQLDVVVARKNLNETAFFFPHLMTDEKGAVKMTFTMPEALTEWKFLGFAHDLDLRGGLLQGTTVTSKDLMIQPNPPRFVREGDALEFTVKVSNQSASQQSGSVRLSFANARTLQSVDEALGNSTTDKSFDVPAGESKTVSWKVSIPDGTEFLTYKAVGSTGRLSDGEEGFLPVLSQRVLVTESMSVSVRRNQEKQFDFKRLADSVDSKTLRHKSLTLQMTSNPTWYAVLALPYLMEYPHQCNEQTFNRLYANALAQHIAVSNPKIERIFAQWRNTPALDSPLEKNASLKQVLLEETPWYRQARRESQARRDIGILFDGNRLKQELQRSMDKLSQGQNGDGRWSWFPGGRGDTFITLYITTGFGRLRHLGVDVDMALALKSLAKLDAWVDQRYQNIKPEFRDDNHLDPQIALYLYGRSFFIKDAPIAAKHRTAIAYWLNQSQRFWLSLENRLSQAHISLALKRFGKAKPAEHIVESFRQRSVSDDEMGMYWRDTERSWWWYRAPIETQAMMIEAFDEVAGDRESVEQCQIWLLRQKQTQDWKTTKATADAVYALLLRGSDHLASDALVGVSLGQQEIKPDSVEPGTGFFEHRIPASEISPELSQIELKGTDSAVSWGSVHWQYMEDISKVTAHQSGPLSITKQLFIKRDTNKGPMLERVISRAKEGAKPASRIAIGDRIVVRLVLKTDRDMEYVHLKDHRASGTEPAEVLSGYRYKDGLAVYQSTRDTATHFYIDYLPKGTYVLEYTTLVQHKGKYQSGFANLQCMYAPEFNSHSESLSLQVR